MDKSKFDEDFFYKVRIEEHELIKEWFFDEYQSYIDTLPLNPSRTDYQLLMKGVEPPYHKFWRNYVDPYLKDFCSNFGVVEFIYTEWIAQYDTDIDHHWHMHPQSDFGAVYYLELPHNQLSTEFWKKNYPAEEGDLVFFPNWWIHRSTPNYFNKRKTVIAGNLSFKGNTFLP